MDKNRVRLCANGVPKVTGGGGERSDTKAFTWSSTIVQIAIWGPLSRVDTVAHFYALCNVAQGQQIIMRTGGNACPGAIISPG